MERRIFAYCIMFLIMLSSYALAAEPVEEWVKRYDNGSYDGASALAVDSLGNVYVTGYSYSYFNEYGDYTSGYATIKYDASGNELWARRYDTSNWDYATAIAVDSSGNVYVTGYSYVSWGSTSNHLTIKYDTNGNELWAKKYYDGTFYGNFANVLIAVDSLDNVYVVGTSGWYASSGYDYSIIKYDINGNELWTRRYDASNWDYATALTVDSSGNVYVTGFTSDYTTIKYDTNGNELWVKRYDGGYGAESPSDLALDSSGNVYVTGYSYSSNGTDYATIKYDTNGNELWVKRYDNGDYEGATAIVVDSSGNIYVTGSSSSDYATIKYDANGNELWVKRYDNGVYEGANALAVDSSGNVYVTGTGGYSDYLTIKYKQSPSTPAEVINVVDAMLASGKISSTAIANAIIFQLSNAQNNLQTNPISAANMLNAAINLIDAQSGKKITTESAETLIRYLTGIIAGL